MAGKFKGKNLWGNTVGLKAIRTTEEKYNELSEAEKARTDVVYIYKKVIKSFLMMANKIGYKNGKSVEEELDTLNSTITGEVSDTGWDLTFERNELKKNSKVVSINVVCRREYGIPDYHYSFFSVPQGFRPSKPIFVPLVLANPDWSDVKYATAEISPNGEVNVFYSINTSGYNQARICGTWIID